MRTLRTIICIVLLAASLPAVAQFRFGVKGGAVVSKLSFDKNALSSENRAGWCAGFQVDLSLPVTGLAVDASLLYSHRNDAISHETETYRRDYIEIPLHLRYGLSIIGVNRFVIPYVFTGPNFSFLCSESKNITWDNRSAFTSWDVGFGAELFKHVQIQASYGIGITEAFKKVGIDKESVVISGKDRCWTISAAVLF